MKLLGEKKWISLPLQYKQKFLREDIESVKHKRKNWLIELNQNLKPVFIKKMKRSHRVGEGICNTCIWQRSYM